MQKHQKKSNRILIPIYVVPMHLLNYDLLKKSDQGIRRQKEFLNFEFFEEKKKK